MDKSIYKIVVHNETFMVPSGPNQIEAPFPHMLANDTVGSVVAPPEAVPGNPDDIFQWIKLNFVNR